MIDARRSILRRGARNGTAAPDFAVPVSAAMVTIQVGPAVPRAQTHP
jgi:hypothetical protein